MSKRRRRNGNRTNDRLKLLLARTAAETIGTVISTAAEREDDATLVELDIQIEALTEILERHTAELARLTEALETSAQRWPSVDSRLRDVERRFVTAESDIDKLSAVVEDTAKQLPSIINRLDSVASDVDEIGSLVAPTPSLAKNDPPPRQSGF